MQEEDSSSRRDKLVVQEIAKLKKNKSQIVFSDGSKIICENDVLLSFPIRIGESVSPEVLASVIHASEKTTVRNYFLALLSRQRYSRKSLQDKILRRKADKSIVAEVLDELESLNMIDDMSLAKDWISMRLHTHPEGKAHLYIGLMKKGIEKSQAKRAVSEAVPFSVEYDAAKNFLERQHGQPTSRQELYVLFKKRGFSNEVIREIIRSVEESK